MLNLQGSTLLKPSLYDLIGIATRSAWQGYKPQILVASRDMFQILTTSVQSYSLACDPLAMITGFHSDMVYHEFL